MKEKKNIYIQNISIQKTSKTFNISNDIEFLLLNRINYEAKKCIQFPNGNILFVVTSYVNGRKDLILNKILILNSEFKLIQKIENIFPNDLLDIYIKDNNSFAATNFSTNFYNKQNELKIWTKNINKNNFQLTEVIKGFFTKIIFLKNGTLLLSNNDSIHIYEEININKHQLCCIIKINSTIFDIKLRKKFFICYHSSIINDKTIKGNHKMDFYSLSSYKIDKSLILPQIKIIEFKFLDDNRILSLDSYDEGLFLKIISPQHGKIIKNFRKKIKTIDNSGDICVIKNKNLFLVGAYYIYVYNSENYKTIEIIKPPSEYEVNKFIKFNNQFIKCYMEHINKLNINNKKKEKKNLKGNLHLNNNKLNYNKISRNKYIKKSINKYLIGIVYNIVEEEQ